jgi:hypothetical protein
VCKGAEAGKGKGKVEKGAGGRECWNRMPAWTVENQEVPGGLNPQIRTGVGTTPVHQRHGAASIGLTNILCQVRLVDIVHGGRQEWEAVADKRRKSTISPATMGMTPA